jgi:hypothetical protein
MAPRSGQPALAKVEQKLVARCWHSSRQQAAAISPNHITKGRRVAVTSPEAVVVRHFDDRGSSWPASAPRAVQMALSTFKHRSASRATHRRLHPCRREASFDHRLSRIQPTCRRRGAAGRLRPERSEVLPRCEAREKVPSHRQGAESSCPARQSSKLEQRVRGHCRGESPVVGCAVHLNERALPSRTRNALAHAWSRRENVKGEDDHPTRLLFARWAADGRAMERHSPRLVLPYPTRRHHSRRLHVNQRPRQEAHAIHPSVQQRPQTVEVDVR